MNIKKALDQYAEHQKVTVKEKTMASYRRIMDKFQAQFSDREVDSIGADEVCQFLESQTQGLSRATRRLKYSQLKAFFHFTIDANNMNMKNPCHAPVLFKSFRSAPQRPRQIIDKESVDEMIFRSGNTRNRLILELQARCGLRIGEVLHLRAEDVAGRRLTIQEPKSGREGEIAFMPEHIATRMADYISSKKFAPGDLIFPVCYTTVRNMVSGLGKKLGIHISPHDLRRHSATYASRNGVPLEIISKVILRHADLKTTQVYLGKVSDTEAIRWMDILHGK
ncbi:MAG: site-specific integrase [Thermodesulfovibrionales bacterium]